MTDALRNTQVIKIDCHSNRSKAEPLPKDASMNDPAITSEAERIPVNDQELDDTVISQP